ncbi:sacsin N-terminal ATP-binding-like domain-containing protein [Actinoplanes sp. L3-i22]|uniref:sacsin N-terminal ATP-binding-like domain-containing protein n=1 Tax=Actinoplanes sp. L3-i22 TaxID=2836373 RepID=UPI001C759C2E|nr:DUF3883 domain-containing protein [Actinoplanes sp. L3-i22]BCY13458.1 hypothetical protein L3i22_085460 [Actinoplanes sp. L3-i22]
MDQAARLRAEEFAAITAQVKESLHRSLFKSLDERGGAQELIRQQYSGRYPFELLQNANDAATAGRASFVLTDTALIVADDGLGFQDVQVEAICSLGRSSKGPGTAVGHKGLGFKSVGEITDRPQVVSTTTRFQFDGAWLRREIARLAGPLPAGQRLPVYAFPFPVDPADLGPDAPVIDELLGDGFRTVIRLPLREGVGRDTVASHLVTHLRPRLLLFLPGIDRLDLHGAGADFSAHVTRSAGGRVSLGDEEWLVHRHEAAPPRELLAPLGEAWAEIEVVRWSLAVPLGADGRPRTDELFPMHVYFPTEEEPGLHVMVHAEWVLGMDRRQLAATPEAVPYNRWLTARVAESAGQLGTALVTGYDAVTAVVPADSAPTPGAGEELRDGWREVLAGTAFLPVADGSLARPVEVGLLPESIPDAAVAHQIAGLDGSRALRPDLETAGPVRSFLTGSARVEAMTVKEFMTLLRPPSPETAARYYGFLADWRDQASGRQFVGYLRELPCVLTVHGEVVAPAHEPVFFPRTRGDSLVSVDLPVPIAEVPGVEGVEALLKELGVRPFEWRELISSFLLRILADPSADPERREQAMAGLWAYHEVRRTGSESLVPALGTVLLPARTAAGDRVELRAGATMYFGADWTGSEDLEAIYGPFGEAEFLAAEAPGDSDQRHADREFYEMLGVRDHPRLDEAHGSYPVDSHRHPHRGAMFHRWRVQPEVEKAERCPQSHAYSQQLRYSYRLDRHEDLAASQEPLRLLALWRQLASRWGDVYEPAMTAVFHCTQSQHAGERDRQCDSLFAYTLRSQPWVPVARGSTSELVRPQDGWIDQHDLPRRIRERIPRIHHEMRQMKGGVAVASALHVTDAGRPRADDLLALLSGLAEEADDLGRVTRDVELAARWVQRTLDDVLIDETPHADPASVRVLARHDGRLMFAAQPLFADEPLLKETWERHEPMLHADTGLGRLVRYLSLVRLDDVVTTVPEPFVDHLTEPVQRAVTERIEQAKPYLLALVRAENARAETMARNTLSRLRLVLCDDLILRYEYEGHAIERDDAVCYIATRFERHDARPHRVGTVYLELDRETREPHWFPFGRQLAQHLDAPSLADAVTMVFTARKADLKSMMADRQIRPEDIDEAHELLGLPAEEEIGHILDNLVTPTGGWSAPGSSPTPAPGSSPPAAADASSSPSPESAAALATGAASSAPAPVSTSYSASAEPAPAADPIPPVDYGQVRLVEGTPGALAEKPVTARHGGYGGAAPSVQTDAENRRVGNRGEGIAYHVERERLRAAGRDPDLVVWESRINELSPYDLRSVDDDGRTIFIEVKSTRADDPGEPFYISGAELLQAAAHRDRYIVYRVTRTDTATPLITRIADPLGRINDGNGRLLLSKAQMTLAVTAGPAHDRTRPVQGDGPGAVVGAQSQFVEFVQPGRPRPTGADAADSLRGSGPAGLPGP